METLSGLDIQQLTNITSPPSDIIYLINYLLYNESISDIWNINANINDGNYDKVILE